ncbi:MAG: nitroreductase family protein [Candidatus Thorarchaeota archaeon]
MLLFIKGRRSIRSFKKTPIPKEKIEMILEAGRWAPSAVNSQPWKFLVITNKEKVREIAKTGLGGLILKRAPVIIGVVSDKVPSKINLSEIENGLSTYAGDPNKLESTISMTRYLSCGLAIMNMLLMIHSLGMGACCVGAIDRDIAKKVIGLEENEILVLLISVGDIKKNITKPSLRNELKAITRYID